MFENHETFDNSLERTSSTVNVKRSPSILSKLAKFQQKGMDIGVGDESLNGVPLEESASEPEEDDDDIDGTEDPNLVRARRAAAQREIPLHFNNMSEVMSKWESGNQMTKEERREERKQEIQSIRSRLFMVGPPEGRPFRQNLQKRSKPKIIFFSFVGEARKDEGDVSASSRRE